MPGMCSTNKLWPGLEESSLPVLKSSNWIHLPRLSLFSGNLTLVVKKGRRWHLTQSIRLAPTGANRQDSSVSLQFLVCQLSPGRALLREALEQVRSVRGTCLLRKEGLPNSAAFAEGRTFQLVWISKHLPGFGN